ncbi:MAG: hypothetical protein CSA95_07375 [Bacteroidetes bacterium]|nr:MAG: hypothetical protein CSA95_07375 [Bacteroidota bacterium]
MRKIIYFVFLLFVFLAGCSSPENVDLNKMSEYEFQSYIQKGVERCENQQLSVLDYLDSLSVSSVLDDRHKAQINLRRTISLYWEGKLEAATTAYKTTLQQNNGEVNATLISAYYLLGSILQTKNQLYQSLYYYNKAGELLRKYDIYHTLPLTADKMLIRISFSNKYLNQVNSANRFMDAAIHKYHTLGDTNKQEGANLYLAKCFMFSSRENLHKDSLDFYINKAMEMVGQDSSDIDMDNLNYLKAEYYYNTRQVDSALFYMQQLSQEVKDQGVGDEINLLSIYSRKKQYEAADKQLLAIQKFMDKGSLNAEDSLSFFNNLVDYHLSRNEYAKTQKAFDTFLDFQAKFNNREAKKNINELASVIDLQQKEEELAKVKRAYEISLQKRNLIITVSVLLLLTMLAFLGYMKSQSDRRKLFFENRANMMKIRLLQTQIKPHFIFNTLASIQSLIRLNQNDRSIKYLSSFSLLLRQILDLSRNARISLDKELDMIKAYVEMQKLRKPNFELKIELSPEVEAAKHDMYLPALILQPFVENAIVHGFNNIDYKGEIRIRIEDKLTYLFVRISDNGCGLQPQPTNSNTSHGIDIIREHLHTLANDSKTQAGLEIKNHTDTHGTLVELKIPLMVS